MTSIFEQLGGTYTQGSDGMLYPNLSLWVTGNNALSTGGDGCTEPTWKQIIPACMIG